jgi:hypothetical protein
VAIEANRAPRETVEIGRSELAPAVGANHVAIEAVEQDYDCVSRTPRHDFVRAHLTNASRGESWPEKRSNYPFPRARRSAETSGFYFIPVNAIRAGVDLRGATG